jgi:hypothetical protein
MTINQFYGTIFRSTESEYTARQKLRNDLSVPRAFGLVVVASRGRALKLSQSGNVYMRLLWKNLALKRQGMKVDVTYLLHAAVLLEKLNGLQLVKKFPSLYGTRRFIIAFTSARQLSLS